MLGLGQLNAAYKNAMVTLMSEGNNGAREVLDLMQQSYPDAQRDIDELDRKDVRGSKIWMLWSDCCGKDMALFRKTIEAIRTGRISYEELHANLNQVYAKPFDLD